MKRYVFFLTFFFSVGFSFAENWPQFRGDDQSGVITGFEVPASWSAEKGIKWRIPSPGMGWSSPIVWGNKIFLTGSSLSNEEMRNRSRGGGQYRTPEGIALNLEVICLDKGSGAILWRSTAYEGESKVATHGGSPYSAETPATDGNLIFAYFGTMGLYAFSFDGKLVWQKDMGVFKMDGEWGTATSPIVHDGKLFLQVDGLGYSRLSALATDTGKKLWHVDRDEGPNRGSPYIWKNHLREELVTQGAITRSFNPENGEMYWQLDLQGGRSSSTPVGDEDRLIVANEKRDAGGNMFSIRAGASGNISLAPGKNSNEGVEWMNPNGNIAMSSPLLYNGKVYAFERLTGMVNCYDAATGDVYYYRKHVPSARQFWSSPWAYEGHIYCIDGNGITHVLDDGAEFKVVRQNRLDDQIWATPAFTPDSIIIKGREYIYSVESKGATPSLID